MKFYCAKEDKTQSFRFSSDDPFKKRFKSGYRPTEIIIGAESVVFGPGLQVYLKGLVDILATEGRIIIKKGKIERCGLTNR